MTDEQRTERRTQIWDQIRALTMPHGTTGFDRTHIPRDKAKALWDEYDALDKP